MKRAAICLMLLLCLAACGQTRTVSQVLSTPASSPSAAPTPEPTPEPTPTPEPLITREELEQVIARAGEDWHAMGVQAAVIQEGAVIAQAAWGWAVDGQVPMTTEHKLRCASLTKLATALAAGVLMEQGIITPQSDLSRCWGVTVRNPAYPDCPITVDMLLTHTSSLTDASGSLAALKGTAARQRLAGGGFQGVEPGALESWCYNNYGFAVLGMSLELASGRMLDAVLGEAILTPLGIDAAFEAGSVADTSLLCPLYQGDTITRPVAEQLGYVRVEQPGYRGNFYAGGFTCSAGDMARLAALLAADGQYQGEQLLAPETVAYLEQPLGEVPGGFLQCRPLRCRTELYGRDRIYYHTGSAYGFYGLVSYDPDTGDGVAVFTTGAAEDTDDWGIYQVCSQIARAVYRPEEREALACTASQP